MHLNALVLFNKLVKNITKQPLVLLLTNEQFRSDSELFTESFSVVTEFTSDSKSFFGGV